MQDRWRPDAEGRCPARTYARKGRELARKQGKEVVHAYPKEGVIGGMDTIMIPARAGNAGNAKIFMMDAENMGTQSNVTGYGNTIKRADKS
mgnify:CR=1 FL=1